MIIAVTDMAMLDCTVKRYTKLKSPIISNGRKRRGILVASKNTPLITRELKSEAEMSLDRVNEVFDTKQSV